MWSNRRLPERLESTDYARRLEHLRQRAGDELVDLTLSNPSRIFPEHRREMREAHRAAVEEAGERPYAPEPLGLLEARRAISDYYDDRGGSIPPERIGLTASTSEAYTWLAKLFADPGGSVLVPTPSYPLFEHLMRLECVEVDRYHYRFDGRWHLDAGHLRRQLGESDDPRAIFAVSPNNPTGHVLSDDEFSRLAAICSERSLPLVVDEVFVDFGLDDPDPRSVASRVQSGERPPLVAVLSGLSKTAALPGAKVGWMALAGDEAEVDGALRRLEFVGDTFLSVATASQLLVPRILDDLGDFHRSVRVRTRENLATLRDRFDALSTCDIYPAEAGWYAVARLPGFVDPADWSLDLLEDSGVLVQPGFLYDFRRGSHIVLSLLPAKPEFTEGVDRLADHLRDELS